MPKKDLPIVWYLDEASLPEEPDRGEKLKKIADAITAWEADGDQSLNVLKAKIDKILKS